MINLDPVKSPALQRGKVSLAGNWLDCNQRGIQNGKLYGERFFIVSTVGERPWWPIQSLNNGRKKKAKGYEEREIRSSLLILDLKDGKL